MGTTDFGSASALIRSLQWEYAMGVDNGNLQWESSQGSGQRIFDLDQYLSVLEELHLDGQRFLNNGFPLDSLTFIVELDLLNVLHGMGSIELGPNGSLQWESTMGVYNGDD